MKAKVFPNKSLNFDKILGGKLEWIIKNILFGIVLLFPHCRKFGFRLYAGILGYSIWINLMLILWPLIDLGFINEAGVFFFSAIFTLVFCFVFLFRTIKYVKSFWVEKVLILDLKNIKMTINTLFDLEIERKEEFFKIKGIKQIDDKEKIEKYKQENRKAKIIAAIYLLITLVNFYFLSILFEHK